MDRDRFERDLLGKQHVILLFDAADDALQGFSTLEVYTRTLEGRTFAVVYSGDTIIAPGYWGQTALGVAFVRFVLACKLRRPILPLYWFLISKGYKTFFLLSHNFPEYWPRHDQPTPARPAAILSYLATDKFGGAFLPARGILHFDPPLGRLRAGVAPIEPALLADPEVRFFVEKNPGHEQGDELCCLGRIDLRMGLFYLSRLVRRGLRSLVHAKTESL